MDFRTIERRELRSRMGEPACCRLVELLKPGGVLHPSWRVTGGDSARYRGTSI